MADVAAWLAGRGVTAYCERAVHATEFPGLTPFDPSAAADQPIDFCVALGGDGTVLRLASLFDADEPLPPVVSLAMG